MGGAAASVTIPNSPDTTHLLRYRATDAAGNAGAEQQLTVHVDAVGPTTTGKAAWARAGRAVKLRYRVTDGMSPRANAVTIVVRNARPS